MAGWLHEFGLRVKALFGKRRLEREMAEELEFHQVMLREKLARDSGEAAGLDAGVRHTFGDARRWHERLTELWQFRWLESLRRDVVFGARVLCKSPGFTIVALLTLILGIGANAAVFSLINGLLLRPLPVPHADELAMLAWRPEGVGYTFSVPVFRALEKRADLFQNVFAFTGKTFQARNGNKNEAFGGELVSGQFFQGLEVQPELGRYLAPEDDTPGSSPVVVISHAFWKNWFNGAPDVVGRKLILNDVAFTVVGVMPATFIGIEPENRPALYAALALEQLLDTPFNNTAQGYRAWWFQIGARRKPNMSLAQTQAALQAISKPLLHEVIPDPTFQMNNIPVSDLLLTVEPGSSGFSFLRKRFRDPLLVVFVLCGAVLMLACLNLASLLMARGAAREREIATRLAIGATRRRVVQQLLVESMLLAFTGTIVGFLVAPFAARWLAMLIMKSDVWLSGETTVDIRTLLFCAGIAILCTLVIGLVPALQASSGSLQDQARQGSHNLHTAQRQRRMGRALLAVEVALALVVVTGAGLLGASLLRLYRIGLGFDARGVALVDIDLGREHWKDVSLLQFYQNFAEQASRIRGVSAVSYANITPISGSYAWNDSWNANGKKEKVYRSTIGPDYFHVMRIPVRAGREFTWNDTAAAPRRVILNEMAAKYFFPNGNAVGQQIRDSEDKDAKTFEVVAVVGNTKYIGMRETMLPIAYMPLTQQDEQGLASATAVIHISGKPGPVADAVRDIASRMIPEAPSLAFTTLEEQVNRSIISERMMAMLAGFFAVCALLVTAIGLYGTLAYTTARRTSEIGIRMALGAQPGQVAMLIFRENAMVAIVGSLAGLGIALPASHALAALLYNTSTHDVSVMLLSVVALGAIACVASLLPALRASRIEPMHAIRYE